MTNINHRRIVQYTHIKRDIGLAASAWTDSNLRNHTKLDIWDRAQREAARGRKFDRGDNLGDEIWLLRKPLGNAIALAYTARTVFILGG